MPLVAYKIISHDTNADSFIFKSTNNKTTNSEKEELERMRYCTSHG